MWPSPVSKLTETGWTNWDAKVPGPSPEAHRRCATEYPPGWGLPDTSSGPEPTFVTKPSKRIRSWSAPRPDVK